jgi:hypothetical protein
MYPRYFSRTINIMGSVLSTGFEGVFSVHTVWSDSGDENGCLSGKVPKLGIIEIADLDSYIRMSIFKECYGGKYNYLS